MDEDSHSSMVRDTHPLYVQKTDRKKRLAFMSVRNRSMIDGYRKTRTHRQNDRQDVVDHIQAVARLSAELLLCELCTIIKGDALVFHNIRDPVFDQIFRMGIGKRFLGENLRVFVDRPFLVGCRRRHHGDHRHPFCHDLTSQNRVSLFIR